MTENTFDGVEDIVFDDDERIEIACSFPNIKTAIKALHEFVQESKS